MQAYREDISLVDAIAALFPEDSFAFPEGQSPSPPMFSFEQEALPSSSPQDESPRIMMIYAKTFPKEAGIDHHERDFNTNSDDSYCTSESDSAQEPEDEHGARSGALQAAPATGRMPKSVQRSMWSPKEHQKFLDALKKFNISCNRETKEDGRMYAGLGPHVADLIAMDIGTRTVSQVRSHAQKYFQRLSRQRTLSSPVQE
eukprot:759732-Hanusia_phi.AAC.3